MSLDTFLVILLCIACVNGTGHDQSEDTRLTKLETMVRELSRDRDSTVRRLHEVEESARKQKVDLENELSQVQSKLSILQQKYSLLETSSGKSVRTTSGTAKFAFFASLNNRTSHYNRDEKIVMDHVLTNNGNSYNHQTGVFTCHQPGTYVFYLTIQVEDGHSFTAEIVRNGKEIARVLNEPRFSRESSSTSVIVNLAVGDVVFVRSDGYFDQSNASLDEHFSSFSGFLIEVGDWIDFGTG
uniref:C1q domain-containing protein 2 n=1 Tax=Argopecten irradians TaxID=31199 RepID=D3YHP4_ARGIR|nr:C1q domain-containing protein 2 [Argopecten irradians]